MGAGTLTLNGVLTGFEFGQRVVNMSWTLTAAIDDSSPAYLVIGDNVFQVPQGATLVWFDPPPGNIVPMTFKGAPGDTGFALHPGFPSGPIALAVAQTSFILNVASLLPGPVQVSYA